MSQNWISDFAYVAVVVVVESKKMLQTDSVKNGDLQASKASFLSRSLPLLACRGHPSPSCPVSVENNLSEA